MKMGAKEVVCDRCDTVYFITEKTIKVIRDGDLEVQFFSCPQCGLKCQIITTNQEMRDLIEKRKELHQKIRMAMAKHFRGQTIRGYERQLEKVKAAQERLLPELKQAGRRLLDDNSAEQGSEKHDEGGSPNETERDLPPADHAGI